MNTPDFLKPDWGMKLALRHGAAILGILLFVALVVHTPFGPLLFLGAICYGAYHIWTGRPTRTARPRQRNSGGAERTPVLPGEARR